MKSRLDPLTLAAMLAVVVSFSATAPLTAAASASPLAMAFWRSTLGFLALWPILLLLRRRQVVRVVRRERRLLRREQVRPLVFGFLAATSLALHFATFMTSTRMTSVAMSTALVATQPVWQALIAAAQGVRFSRTTWLGLALAVVGAAAAAGLDVRGGGEALTGDLLALVGAMALAGYTALSQQARSDVSTPLYSTVSSLVCGVELFVVCWLADVPLTGFDTATHLSLLGLLLLPQLLGLGSLNFALGRASATTMSVLLLLESPVAALAAWLLMGQSIDPGSVPGLLLIIAGVTVVTLNGQGEQPAPRRGRHRRGAVPSHGDSGPAPYVPRPVPVDEEQPSAPDTSPPAHLPHARPPVHAARTEPGRDHDHGWGSGWGGGWDEYPTLTLTLAHHGTGAFGPVPPHRSRKGEPDAP
ncbi:DMT family transporter [Streptomyces sp. NPDC054796]